jgi:hypothetical protein
MHGMPHFLTHSALPFPLILIFVQYGLRPILAESLAVGGFSARRLSSAMVKSVSGKALSCQVFFFPGRHQLAKIGQNVSEKTPSDVLSSHSVASNRVPSIGGTLNWH